MHQSILSKYFIYLRDLHAKASKISEIEITLQLPECTPGKWISNPSRNTDIEKQMLKKVAGV